MIELIFPLHADNLQAPAADYNIDDVISLQHQHQMSLFIAPCRQLAASLLLQAAVSYNAKGCLVVFITAESWNSMPKLVHAMPTPDSVLMNRVRMLYMNHYELLINFLSDVHRQLEAIPDVIIVHGLDSFIDVALPVDNRQHAMTRLFALLSDTSQFIADRRETCGSHVILSMCDTDNVYSNVYSRFVNNLWNICPTVQFAAVNTTDQVVCDGEFVAVHEFNSLSVGQLCVVFTVTDGCIFLHSISLSSAQNITVSATTSTATSTATSTTSVPLIHTQPAVLQ